MIFGSWNMYKKSQICDFTGKNLNYKKKIHWGGGSKGDAETDCISRSVRSKKIRIKPSQVSKSNLKSWLECGNSYTVHT
jgi:hypothetical protein